MICTYCQNHTLIYLGQLGDMHHYRCRCCGWDAMSRLSPDEFLDLDPE